MEFLPSSTFGNCLSHIPHVWNVWQIRVPSMWFWSVYWSTNCLVFFLFFLVNHKKIVQFQGIFGQSLGIFGRPKKNLVDQKKFWYTKKKFGRPKIPRDWPKIPWDWTNFFLVDQKKWEKDRTIGRPRDWPKPHGRDFFLYKRTAFFSGTPNFFGPSYLEAALVLD